MPLQPLLMVGVGGSGAKTLRTLRQVMMRRLRMQGWEGSDLPVAWQMLAVDTVTDQSRDGYPAPLLPGTDYLGLVQKPGVYEHFKVPMVEAVPQGLRQDAFLGWLPEKVPGSLIHGAGQNRAVGRAVAAAKLGDIRAGLKAKLDVVSTQKAIQSLNAVAPLLGATGVSSSPMAWVISSLAGGTGAGMFLDVIEALKAVDMGVGEQTQVVLFGPEVFQPLIDGGQGAGIGANTLAAISEITSGVWSAAPSKGTTLLYGRGGMQAAAAGRAPGKPAIGSRYNYVIGATNANGVPIGTLDAAYQAVGDSLAALLLDENVLDRFNNFFRINVFDNTWNPNTIGDQSGLKSATDAQFTQPFASFGSSRVSLGMDRFLEYSTEAFTREVVERLLWPRFTPDDPKLNRPDHERVRIQVELSQGEFIAQTGLNERGEENNAVLDAIDASEAKGIAGEFAASIVAKARGGVGSGGLPPADWLQRIMDGIVANDQELRIRLTGVVEARAKSFAATLEERLNRATSGFIARQGHGFNVGVELLKWLRDELTFVAGVEMPAEGERFQTLLTGIRAELSSVLEIGMKAIPVDHEAVRAAEAALRNKYARMVYEAIRRRIAGELLRAVEAELLAPMQSALEGARVELMHQAERPKMEDGNPNPFSVYPRVGDKAGKRFAPGPTELLLVPVTSYTERLEEVLRHTYGADLAGQWKQRTIERIILDLGLAEQDEERARGILLPESEWMPSRPELRWIDGAPQRPSYSPLAAIDGIRERAERLFTDTGTAIGKFVGQSLEDFLTTPDAAERQRRETDFIEKLIGAFESSAPLANIQGHTMAAVHPVPDGVGSKGTIAVSRIPLDPSGALYAQVEGRLTQAGIWDADTSPGWFGRTSAPQVDVFQALGRATSAIVHDSLMGPVAQAWAAVRNDPKAAKGFWTWRRSRPLTESIPASHDQLASMAAGWVIAGLLSLRRDEIEVDRASTLVSIWDPEGQRWTSFPSPMFDRRVKGFAVFPAVLAALPLAMVEANATSSIAAFAPYKALLAYGETDATGPMGRWILDGRTVTPGKAPEPDPAKAGIADMPESERKALVLARIDRDIALFEEHCTGVVETRDMHRDDAAWELRDLMRTAYEDAKRATQALERLDV